MAQTAFMRLNEKAVCVFGVLCVLLMIQKGTNGFEFKVGGSEGNWTVPSDPKSAIYNQWAEKNRFQIGDTLLFVYAADKDSVLHVTKDDYTNCNTAAPLEKFTDGHTVIKFNESGPHYFISGVADKCQKNEKVHVIVMADRNKAPAEVPPPSKESSPPHNGGSSIVASAIATIVCSSLVLAI
ncbi:hypothetical protein BUALT_Bualt18G0062500 [Buddleja alternifolia]|uniref:Phytocyanin domain-containing protein n=1 Tax=Buddleja alternifolia TaxID=168488 RepID=A0AAV6WDB5_9LAMI|nr:hypothetical protein BUALT_Bualt18G0062500 [Buddleja alternifolia]